MSLATRLLLCYFVACSLGQQQQQVLRDSKSSTYDPFASADLDDHIEQLRSGFHTPGIAIAVVHHNKTWAKGYGYADMEGRIAVTPKTLFPAGSTTKSFTAAIAALLVHSDDSEYADIAWSTTLASLIRDDFVLQDEYAMNHITLTDALSHRTGMPRHDMSWVNGDPSPREQVRQMRHSPMHHEIRQKWEYCNVMFAAVGHAVATVTGRGLGQLFEDLLWKPLNMTETFFDVRDALEFAAKKNPDEITVAHSYLWNAEAYHLEEVSFADVPPSTGAGSVVSNVLDYTKWIRQFLHPESDSPLSPSMVHDLTSAHMIIPEDELPFSASTYGLGLFSSSHRGHQFVMHTGSIAGYNAHMLWIPKYDWGCVILQNSYSLAHHVAAATLMDDFLDEIGDQGERIDMLRAMQSLEARASARLEPENARKSLYPDAPASGGIAPALPLTAYEGLYHHPAYHNITLSLAGHSKATGGAEQSLSGAPLPLYGKPSAKSYLDQSWTFHHVSGEQWWAYWRTGPGYFLEDEVMKAKFELGVDGTVKGLRLQAEPAIEELAWFEKIAHE